MFVVTLCVDHDGSSSDNHRAPWNFCPCTPLRASSEAQEVHQDTPGGRPRQPGWLRPRSGRRITTTTRCARLATSSPRGAQVSCGGARACGVRRLLVHALVVCELCIEPHEALGQPELGLDGRPKGCLQLDPRGLPRGFCADQAPDPHQCEGSCPGPLTSSGKPKQVCPMASWSTAS